MTVTTMVPPIDTTTTIPMHTTAHNRAQLHPGITNQTKATGFARCVSSVPKGKFQSLTYLLFIFTRARPQTLGQNSHNAHNPLIHNLKEIQPMTNRTSTRLRYLTIDHADLTWIIANIGRALERAHRDTHPGIAPNGLTADDGSHPGPIPHLVATRAVTGDDVRRARDQLLEALDTIHHATTLATHAIHRLLPMRPEDARTLAENETIDPTPLPCSNCLNPAEPGRSQCAACRKYRARHGTDRPTNLTTKATSHSNTPLALAMPTTPAEVKK